MDPKTGKITTIDKLVDGGTNFAIPLGNLPEKNCKRCYGRGHLGQNVDTGFHVPCPCTNPQYPMPIDLSKKP